MPNLLLVLFSKYSYITCKYYTNVGSLGRVFDELLRDKNQEAATVSKMSDGLNTIARTPLQGKFKV